MSNKKEIQNPFVGLVTYEDILKEITEGVSVKEYYKDVISDDEISVLESELKYYKRSIAKAKEAKEEKLTPKQK